jgi:hypothetical protein
MRIYSMLSTTSVLKKSPNMFEIYNFVQFFAYLKIIIIHFLIRNRGWKNCRIAKGSHQIFFAEYNIYSLLPIFIWNSTSSITLI